jgi:hypothetical protein
MSGIYVADVSGADLLLLLLVGPLIFLGFTGVSLLVKAISARYRQRPRLTRGEVVEGVIQGAVYTGLLFSVYAGLWLWKPSNGRLGTTVFLWVARVAVIGGGLGLLWGLLEAWLVRRFAHDLPGQVAAAEEGGDQR